jgi:Domain of unknown function (DUF1992)
MARKRHTPPPISGFDALVEKHISEAQAQGVFDDLPGAGQPLKLDDDAMVPEELRAAYRILKNSGYVPPEVEALRDMREIEQMLERANDDSERSALLARFNALLTRAGALRGRHFAIDNDYFLKVAEKLASRRRG